MPHKNKNHPAEHRKYSRLDTVFPVQFRLENQMTRLLFLAGCRDLLIILAVDKYLDPKLLELLKKKRILNY